MKVLVKYLMGYDSENIPFTFVSDGKGGGVEFDYLRAVCDSAGIDCQFVPMKWNELFQSLDAGKVDAIFSSISRTEERELLYSFTVPYFDSPEAVVYKGRLGGFNSVRSIGVLAGSNHQRYAQSELSALKLHKFPDLKALAEGFQDDSIDSLLVGIDVAKFFIHNMPVLDLKLHEALIVAPGYFGEGSSVVVKKSEGFLLESLNYGISKIGNLSI